jgi:hypothetical protein
MKKYLILLMVAAMFSGACRIKKAGLPKSNNLYTPVQSR